MSASRSKDPARFFTPEESKAIVAAIEAAEKQTSGEIRVHLERKCPGGDPYLRGRDVFEDLGMTQTADRNGVLIYLATQDRLFAVLGDRGIHEKVDEGFWDAIAEQLSSHFRKGDFAGGMIAAIHEIGQRLRDVFPYAGDEQDVNELPNEISVGGASEEGP